MSMRRLPATALAIGALALGCADSASAAPETVIDSHPDALETRDSSANFVFHGEGDVASLECSLDGEAFADCTSPMDYTQLAVGEHEFQVRAVDSIGDEDLTPETFEWEIAADCHGRVATIVSSPGLPTVGTAARDVIVGTIGDDEIQGLGGNDFLCSAKGNDEIRGGTGNDDLLGAEGDDELFGQAGRDELKGGKGTDTCRGGSGSDTASACE
jgi:hemolysin type calcium-binding protein